MDHAIARAPVRHAQWAVTAAFFLHGLLLAAWAPHIASIRDKLGMSDALLGWVLLCLAGGAMAAMQVVGRLIDRFGSRGPLMVTTVGYCALVNAPLHAGSALELAIALLVFGAAAGSMDVSMNAHGATVEHWRGRPCMSSMHGAFSLGALAGAGVAASMLELGFAPWEHTLASSLAAGALALAAFPFLLPSHLDRGSGPRSRARLDRTILLLGLLGLIAMMAEGTLVDWSAIYMREVAGVDPAREGWAFAGFSAAMGLCRIAGDRLSLLFGREALMRISAAIAIAGLLLMAAVPGLVTGVIGATLVGTGVANCVPLVFAVAARAGRAGTAGGGLALVAGVSYCGFLLGPPVIGGVSELFSLQFALIAVAALLLVLVVSRLPGEGDR